ncbi:hypothetical protein QLH52_04100 [Methylomonas sp. OY6]|uniref:Uncharacterized protein n=1 Tax=Methylomonas defluvii TaxID=3045149 RepID=A0ABU4UAS6_9GAMM|nr:hypothetical protein [Methylomonas sp. OY6]MDX8126450.1 hypothetical protein [Methylomonas sp. OY6]
MSKNSQEHDDKRIDFKFGVPELLYKQAGGRCSVPRCKNPTMGPFYEREGAVNMGVACHIHSASKNGPRGWGGKDAEFIGSECNGIWCCQYHASLIDKASGFDYPAEVLFAWKALAEARTRKQMNDSPSPLGWVESIEFTSFLSLSPLPKLTLSRNTIMWGKSCCGKTALLEAAAAISQSKYSDRFNGTKTKGADGKYHPATFCAKIIYSTVDTLSKELNLMITGQKLTRLESSILYILPPGDLEIVFCSESDSHKLKSEDDIDLMMRVLNVDKSALFALASIGTKTIIPGEIKFEHAEEWDETNDIASPKHKEDGSPYYKLLFKMSPRAEFLPYANLSKSEKGRLIIDLLITKAREISKQRLTLLLIESLAINFDAGNFKSLLEALTNEEFQSVVSLPPIRENDVLDNFAGQPKLKKLEYLESWRLAIVGEKPDS